MSASIAFPPAATLMPRENVDACTSELMTPMACGPFSQYPRCRSRCGWRRATPRVPTLLCGVGAPRQPAIRESNARSSMGGAAFRRASRRTAITGRTGGRRIRGIRDPPCRGSRRNCRACMPGPRFGGARTGRCCRSSCDKTEALHIGGWRKALPRWAARRRPSASCRPRSSTRSGARTPGR